MARVLGKGRLLALAVTAVSASIAAVLSPVALSAELVECDQDASERELDVNGDGHPDLVVGAPAEDIGSGVNAGMITVVFGGPGGFGSAGGTVFSQESVGQVSESGDRFGAAVTTGDVIGESCVDLIIGVPGEDGRTGQVVIIPGSMAGLTVAESVVLRQGLDGAPGTAEVGDAFGTSLAVHPVQMERALWVGAPNEDVGAAIDAGVATRLVLDDGLPTSSRVEYAQGVGGIPGAPETGDHFGASLADGLIGAPDEDLGGIIDAGTVTVVGWKAFSQDSPGVPGKAEAGDRFGASLAPTRALFGESTRSLDRP